MSLDFVNLANVVISGLLTGIVYGLMALGLSVIFGVARVVNFAHGEMMALAMYLSVLLFSTLHLEPFLRCGAGRGSLFYFRLRAARGRDSSVRHSSRTFAVHLALGRSRSS